MRMTKTVRVRTRDQWHAWLERHHDVEAGVWLIFYRKHTGQPSIPYADAVEEALCFGWIDSVIQRMSDEEYGRKFTPRKAGSKWSALNKGRGRISTVSPPPTAGTTFGGSRQPRRTQREIGDWQRPSDSWQRTRSSA